MKKLLVILLIFSSYTAFSQDVAQLIVGTWKFDMETYGKSIEQLGAPEKFTKDLIEKSKKVRFIFKADKTIQRIVVKSGNPDEITKIDDGTWKIGKNGKIILNREDKDQKGKVIYISKDKLTIENVKAPAKSSMKTMDLIKVK